LALVVVTVWLVLVPLGASSVTVSTSAPDALSAKVLLCVSASPEPKLT